MREKEHVRPKMSRRNLPIAEPFTIEKIDILKWFLIFSIGEAAPNEHKLFATGWCLTLEGKRLDRGHFIS